MAGCCIWKTVCDTEKSLAGRGLENEKLEDETICRHPVDVAEIRLRKTRMSAHSEMLPCCPKSRTFDGFADRVGFVSWWRLLIGRSAQLMYSSEL